MRVLVLSDVHANLAALNAVLADAGCFDMIWSLGDVVGYGPDPNACISRLREHSHVSVAGNHDWGTLGKLDLADFNPDARHANLWTRDQLTPESRDYLEALPEVLVEGDFTLVHGSPRHPIWEYLLYAGLAKLSFSYYETSTCLVGHTHVPVVFRDDAESERCHMMRLPESTVISLDQERCIVNPGGVGQPRDGDPRAAYLLLDTEGPTIEHRRVAYDIAETQRRMRSADLSPRNIARLEFGW